MRVTNITPVNNYSCLYCSTDFISPVVKINWWFCSKECRFKLAYDIAYTHFYYFTIKEILDSTKEIAGWLK